jgi:phenylalanyl-tRNA synthetase beta chain
MKLSPNWIRDFVDLPADTERLADDLTSIGIAVEGISGSGAETVFEMEIGTNRPDAMNHYGVAREASALYDKRLKQIETRLPKASSVASFPIEIEDAKGCARFTARMLRNVKIAPSSKNVVDRLGLLDQRPINNAVDATNYTLWEIGKPTHVFDLDLLEGGRIIVRHARDGESLKTLDGVERKLTSEDLVVADVRKPVGLAGVMGGYDTMITDKTRNILIESAWWDPGIVRKMSKRHALHTDASHRFERGADFESTVLSTNRVAELILNSGGGELAGEIIDVVARRIDQAPIGLYLSEVQRILGERLPEKEIIRILEHLGFSVLSEGHDSGEFTVHVPSWRLDVEREIDLIEEIARLHGYDKFTNRLPSFSGAVVETPHAAKDQKVRSTLLALGYNETVSLSFISRQDAEQFSPAIALELANPQSEEASVMRTSMIPGMLDMLAHNLNRGVDRVRLFEAGQVFESVGQEAKELKRVLMGASAAALESQIPMASRLDVSQDEHAAASAVFRSLKGDVEQLVAAFECGPVYFDAKVPDYYHPGRSARLVLEGSTVAQFGQLSPEIAAARKIRQDVYLAEVYVDRLYTRRLRQVRFRALPRFPAVERDFSFVFEDRVLFENVKQAATSLDITELVSFVPVEIFRGRGIPASSYSILLRGTFQSAERTLRDDEIGQWSARIIKALESLGGTLRAS